MKNPKSQARLRYGIQIDAMSVAGLFVRFAC